MSRMIPNIEYLGACYDIVTTDPLALASTSLKQNVFDFSKTSTAQTSIGSFDVPHGVTHRTILATTYDTQSVVISSSYDFQESMSQSVKVGGGMDKVFEFSASASYKDIKKRTESRKRSFVYSRAFAEIHGAAVDIADSGSPLTLTQSFHRAIAALPADYSKSNAASWMDFIKRFGTHFTWDITLGGMARQRTSGLSSRFLKSDQTESELKAKADIGVEKLKAGASVEQAQSTVTTSEPTEQVERTHLEFQGGIGSVSGINDAWLRSLSGEPTIVKAQLRRIPILLTSRFFPQDKAIDVKRSILDSLIDEWIEEHGEVGYFTAPLRYGESMLLMYKYSRTNIFQPPIVEVLPGADHTFRYLLKGDKPVFESPAPANIVLESVDGSRSKRPILSGDEMFIKHGPSGRYFAGRAFKIDKSSAAKLVVLHAGDSVTSPTRIGEYFGETDMVAFAKAPLGSSGLTPGISPSGAYFDMVGNPYSFQLVRWDPADDEGPMEK